MNADGSRGVDTDISAGAKIPFLGTLGWVSLGGALVLLITAGTLVYLGLRTPRPPNGSERDAPAGTRRVPLGVGNADVPGRAGLEPAGRESASPAASAS